MFDFEKLDVYQELKQLNLMVYQTLQNSKGIDPHLVSEWKEISLKSVLNLAEGTGRMTPPDKKEYYTLARGAVFKSVAILDLVHRLGHLDQPLYDVFYAGYEKVSKMLLGMVRSQQ